MPVYVYRCTDCGAEIERRQSYSDAPLTTCESCSGPLRRLLFPAGVIFKGSGWYSTDSRATSNGKRDKSDDKEKSSTTESSATTPAAESKSTTKDGGEKATPKKSEATPASTKS